MRANSPIRRSDRYALPARSGGPLPAAPMGIPRRTAFPHLEVRRSPGCKEDTPCFSFRCRFCSFVDPVVRSGAERTRLLRKAFQACSPENALLSNAGTQFCEECPSAQPVGGFRACKAVRGGGPLVLGELARKGSTHPQAPFLFHRARRILFSARGKENGGCILRRKAALPGGNSAPLRKQREEVHSDGQSLSSGGNPAQFNFFHVKHSPFSRQSPAYGTKRQVHPPPKKHPRSSNT